MARCSKSTDIFNKQRSSILIYPDQKNLFLRESTSENHKLKEVKDKTNTCEMHLELNVKKFK